VTRHANATQVEVSLSSTQADLVMEVHDNGSGIPDEAINRADSLGIIGMRERALLLGGELRGDRRRRKVARQ